MAKELMAIQTALRIARLYSTTLRQFVNVATTIGDEYVIIVDKNLIDGVIVDMDEVGDKLQLELTECLEKSF